MEVIMDNERQNKFDKNRNYYTISVYAVGVIVISALCIKLLYNFGTTIRIVNNILGVLSPYLIGIFIAYLLNPLVKKLDILCVRFLHIKNKRVRTVISILLTYLVVFGIAAACIVYIIPQIYESLKTIYLQCQTSYDKLIAFVNEQAKKHPDFDLSYITSLLENNSTTVINFVKNSLDAILPVVYNTSVSVISWTFNIVIAIIVSVYMLIDRNRLITNARKVIFAIMKKERAVGCLNTLSQCNKIFGGFIIGKAIDSTIIGFMCFGFMQILHLKFTVLISVIVGITNMIPYFGPFIGAIPGVIILLTVEFKYALIFAVLILVLQQFDGLYLGPKILGDSTGLRPLWIIFAITVGGWAAGPIGMFLGVPCVAVIAFLTDKALNKKLEKRSVVPQDYTLAEDYYLEKYLHKEKKTDLEEDE